VEKKIRLRGPKRCGTELVPAAALCHVIGKVRAIVQRQVEQVRRLIAERGYTLLPVVSDGV
jgi:hypothetical protein